jgi:hypothetical protein
VAVMTVGIEGAAAKMSSPLVSAACDISVSACTSGGARI